MRHAPSHSKAWNKSSHCHSTMYMWSGFASAWSSTTLKFCRDPSDTCQHQRASGTAHRSCRARARATLRTRMAHLCATNADLWWQSTFDRKLPIRRQRVQCMRRGVHQPPKAMPRQAALSEGQRANLEQVWRLALTWWGWWHTTIIATHYVNVIKPAILPHILLW